MNFLNFISFLSIIKTIPIVLSLYILNVFLQNSSIKKKFMLLLFIFVLFIMLGLFFSLDGIILLFIISELAVLLIFIIMFSQLASFSPKVQKKSGFLVIIFLLLLNFVNYDVNIISYKSFYVQHNYQLNDFFYFFNYYFEKQSIVTLFIIILITLYSLFFIMLYFSVKNFKIKENIKVSKIITLRKQNIIKQGVYSTKIRFFQNKCFKKIHFLFQAILAVYY